MIGFLVWMAWSIGGFFLLDWIGAVPEAHPGPYAVSLLLVMSGLAVGGSVNGWILDRFPNFSKWNLP